MALEMILVPLDGSHLAEAAIPYAEALARLTNSHLCLVAVLEPTPTRVFGPSSAKAARLAERERLDEEQYLAGVADAIGDRGLAVQTRVLEGEPADVLLRTAEQDDITMVAMATRGHGGLDRWLLGGVAEKVMRRCPKPVLLVRPPDQLPPQDRPVELRRILVPLDGSRLAEEALEPALELAYAAGGSLMLARVESWYTPGTTNYRFDPTVERISEEVLAEARAYLEVVRAQLPTVVPIRAVALRGSPAQALMDVVLTERVDLVVMTTHGRGGLKRMVIGSIADRIVRGGAPTLLVRSGRKALTADADTVQPASQPARFTVGDIMAHPAVVVDEDTTLDEVARTMLDRNIGCVPVVNADGRLIGIITEADFTGKERALPFSAYRAPYLFGEWVSKDELESIYAAARSMKAREIMATPVVTVNEDTSVSDAAEKLLRHDITHLPVVRDGQPVGVFARHDLLRVMVNDESSS